MRADAEAGRIPPTLDATAPLMEAVRVMSEARQLNRPVAEFVAQTDFDRPPISYDAMAFLRMFYRNDKMESLAGRKAVGDALAEYADKAQRQMPQMLAGEVKETPGQIIASMRGDIAAQGAMFQRRGPDPLTTRVGGNAPLAAGVANMARRGDIRRGAAAIIDRLRMQVNLDEARARRDPDSQHAPLRPEEAREVEDFIDFIGHHMFNDIGLRIVKGEEGSSAHGAFYPASRAVELFRTAIERGELPRVAVHELWHALDAALPSADKIAVTREFFRQREGWLKDNAWARDFVRGGEMKAELRGPAAADWLRRFRDDPAVADHVVINEETGKKPSVRHGLGKILIAVLEPIIFLIPP